jgi:hypothetical protein
VILGFESHGTHDHVSLPDGSAILKATNSILMMAVGVFVETSGNLQFDTQLIPRNRKLH